MKSLILIPCVAVAMLSSGCLRSEPATARDRGDRAWTISTGGGLGSGSSQQAQRSGAEPGAPRDGETVVVLERDQALYELADERGLSLRWLIERNDFTRRPGPGDRVIVPRQSAGHR
ncbi:MAG: hypothetical protein EA401_13800 [Planctomycetota bacterium]|nr:MAG: hypothetical protein EA401_13800 [Planctomycetota bacterium]